MPVPMIRPPVETSVSAGEAVVCRVELAGTELLNEGIPYPSIWRAGVRRSP